MRELSQEEKEVLKKIFAELEKCELLIGKYDAKNSSEKLMFGISIVMECLAYMISEEFGDEFSIKFIDNMIESEECV